MGTVMKTVGITQLPLEELAASPPAYSTIILNKERFAQTLAEGSAPPKRYATAEK